MRLINDLILFLQRYGHINQTGILDKATRSLMTKPRCGLPDLPPSTPRYNSFSIYSKKRSKRFVKQGNRWKHLSLTWG